MRRVLKGLERLVIAAVIVLLCIGAYIGNTAYEEFRTAQWDAILGVENHARDVEDMRKLEKEHNWEAVRVNAPDGTILRGTYIENRRKSHNTVILLHGLYQNRSMCLPYVQMYRDMDYNVLLIDQRGHGESQGEHTDWGLSEMDDMHMWCQWLREKDNKVRVGLHGISLGAAMALLYAGGPGRNDVAFVIADSSYGNIISLGREKLLTASGDQRAVWGYNMLDPFFQAAMFFHTHKFVDSIEPAQAVKSIKVPILFIHGEADKLVPVKTVHSLYDNCSSGDKHIYIFSESPHAAGIETNRQEYMQVVDRFLANSDK